MGSLKKEGNDDWLKDIKENSLQIMQTIAEKKLNPQRHQLSGEAKKRLRWLYALYYEHEGNVTKASFKLGITRQWLSGIRSIFEKNKKDPRSLEPESKAPHNTKNRRRISEYEEKKILEIRDDSEGVWGKKKISWVLERDFKIKMDPNTVNKYLHKHGKIDPKISLKNSKAWKAKLARENPKIELRVKYRPPKEIKDLQPGALVEKDMKYVPRYGQLRSGKFSENFFCQHTEIDSFTRIRSIELREIGTAESSRDAHKKAIEKFEFGVACENTDNGSENEKEFREELQKENVFHFYSTVGTPTDNPRVERSHLTDELEFYKKGGIKSNFKEQKKATEEWEEFYNWKRPHQALGYLSPMGFYELWKVDPAKAVSIVEKYQSYLKKQKIRLANSRRIKRKEQVQKLMEFIDAKLNKKVGIKKAKEALVNCQLCSVA